MARKQKITPFLWFDQNAEEAMQFYVSVFKNSRILDVQRFGDGAPVPKGTLMMGSFELDGQQFLALNGGPHFKFNEAISLFVDCASQAEVDDLWEKLTSGGGAPSQCGWLKDKFGLSWQIVPSILPELMADKDPAKAKRVVDAMLQMTKIDIAKLKQAHQQS